MLFTELDEFIAESTRNDAIPKDNATRSKGKSLEAMQATLESGDVKVKSENYKSLSSGNKLKLNAFMAENSNAAV